MRQRAAIDVLQLPTNGHAVGDPAGTNASLGGELAKKMGGCLTFNGRIGRKDQLPYDPLVENGFQLTNTELLRTNTVER